MSNANERFNQATYDNLNSELEKAVKKILVYESTTKTPRYLPTDPLLRQNKIDGYKNDLVKSYNDYVGYGAKTYASLDEASKNSLSKKVADFKLKLLRALVTLDLKTDLPSGFGLINIENIVDKSTVEDDNCQIFFNQSTSSGVQLGLSSSTILNETISENVGTTVENPIDNNRAASSPVIEINPKTPEAQQNTENMALLPVEAILSGVTDFSSQSQPQINQFIANADMMMTLAPSQTAIVLTVIRTRLANATALGDISTKDWDEIKQSIRDKYIRAEIPFEMAQEKLLSIKQGPKEDIESYANRTKKLLEILNASTLNANAAVQVAQRAMNESLAVRKFKQNIASEKVRLMAMNIEHSKLMDAISHAYQKTEELKASNVEKEIANFNNKSSKNVDEKTNGNNSNNNNSNGNNSNNKNSNGKTSNANNSNVKNSHGNKNRGNRPRNNFDPCTHCGKTNHTPDRCFSLNRNSDNSVRTENTASANAINAENVTSQPLQSSSNNSVRLFPFSRAMTAGATPVANEPKKKQVYEKMPEITPKSKIYVQNIVQLENNDVVMLVNISICSRQVKLLVDCGAHASMLKSTCIRGNVLYYPEIRYCLIGINGPERSIKTHGAAFGNILINSIALKQQFQIAGDDIYLNYDGILGMDFLNSYKVKIDIESMRLTSLLPVWHNMYEMQERQKFENENANVETHVFDGMIVYTEKSAENHGSSVSVNEKESINDKKQHKLSSLEAKINRLATVPMNSQTNTFKILPFSVRNFKIETNETVICKAKAFGDGIFCNDTIIDGVHDTISVVNNTDTVFKLSDLNIDFEPIGNYSIYQFVQKKNCDKNSRVTEILSKLDMSHCSEQEKCIIKKLVADYNDIFYLDGDGFSFAKNCEHRIPTTPGINPINTRQYRIPIHQKAIAEEKVEQLLKDGVITPSTSLWNSPLLVVPKKSSTDEKKYRLVIDYKNVNKQTETETFPMPSLDEELGKMKGCKYFSTLDVEAAFHQIKLRESDHEKTAFTLNNRKYEYKRMPFGLKGSPITWQLYLTTILSVLTFSNIMAYMDDILTYSKTIDGHTKSLINIFECLRQNNLKLKTDKTKLFAREVLYLGHVINEDGVRPNPKNVEVIKKFPRPNNVKEIQRFVGMASYFRKYIHQFAGKAKSLHNLCKKNVAFVWSPECDESFESLKIALCSAPVLAFPDYSRKFYISTDASFHSVGGYISNDPPPNDRPIEFFSKTLSMCQQNYSTTHKELLAIVMAIEQFAHYIWGKSFVVHTDHEALTYLFSQNKVGSRLLRWKLMLSEYDFEILYRKGKNNVVSDCLSRIPKAEVKCFHLVKNTAIRAIMNVVTRSRAKENAITDSSKTADKPNVSFYMNEEPSITLDTKKYEKILWLIDDKTNISFKKLQLKIKQKIDFNANTKYELQKINDYFEMIFVSKIGFDISDLQTAVMEFFGECMENNIERIAINIGMTTFKNVFEIKMMLKNIFKNSNISITLFMGSQIEVYDVNDINEILRSYHASILGGHRGFERMKNSIRKFYTWTTMSTDIKNYIENCPVCEKTKVHKHTHTPLQITSVASAPFEKIYIDFVGEINPNSDEGHKHIFSISCDLTKYVIMIPVFDCTALTAARAIVEEVCLVFNFPKIIVSDNGPAFIAELFKQMAVLLKIKHTKTTAYHPSSNGSIERYHRTLGHYIRAYTQKEKSAWHRYLRYFIFSYNNTVHTSTGFSPHMLVFGFDVKIPDSVKNARMDYNYDSYRHELIEKLKDAHERAKAMIQERKAKNKEYHDGRAHKTLNLSRNDLVLKKVEVKKNKFDEPYSGPYRVEKIISDAVTQIKIGRKSVIVHNDKLIKAKADHADAPAALD